MRTHAFVQRAAAVTVETENLKAFRKTLLANPAIHKISTTPKSTTMLSAILIDVVQGQKS